MTTTIEPIQHAISSFGELTTVSAAKGGPCQKSLITEESWDHYHLESLLALKETYRENAEFGFLLRHYWIPATILTFRQSSRTTFPDGRLEQCELEIERKMARCRSNECLWREKTRPAVGGDENGGRSLLSEMLCSYDCYEQAYVCTKPILFAPLTAEQKLEARRQALYRLPMLCLPGPVPVRFSWYAKVGNDYMNYRLDAEERLYETSVLIIRREGRYTTDVPPDGDHVGGGVLRSEAMARLKSESEMVRITIERRGITLFAWNRGAVLEDRFLDRVVAADALPSLVGATTQTITRLIRSCPENLTKPMSLVMPRNQHNDAYTHDGAGTERCYLSR